MFTFISPNIKTNRLQPNKILTTYNTTILFYYTIYTILYYSMQNNIQYFTIYYNDTIYINQKKCISLFITKFLNFFLKVTLFLTRVKFTGKQFQ